jgi:hypothetical protein
VSRIELAPEVAEDFDRILDRLASHDVENSNNASAKSSLPWMFWCRTR